MISMVGDFERRVLFEPGANYLHETGPSARGQRGMRIRFLLVGRLGAEQFLMSTSWTPLGPVDRRVDPYLREAVHVDHWYGDPPGGVVRPPVGYDLGYHWARRLFPDQEPFECDVLPGGRCYYDGSGLAAEWVLREFIAGGEDAVWRQLESRYHARAGDGG